MKKGIKYVIIFLVIIMLLLLIGVGIIYISKQDIITNSEIMPKQDMDNKVSENTLVVGIDKQEVNEEPIKEPEQEKDAATLTQEIYDMNTVIGTLHIPKTGLTTEIFSSVIVEKMEKMPCFLYTTGGLNKKGVTLFVGHNRRNGKLFSDNKKLNEGDEFYFKDYEGKELKYIIYSKFTTTEDDVSFLDMEVEKPTIALSCCTDANDENRIIIIGRAD